MSNQRLPPHDAEAEMSVLGAMLLGDRPAVDKAAAALKCDDFYRDAHGRIFEAILALAERNEPVDIVTLKDELTQGGLFDAIGGIEYLIQLGEFVPTTANVAYYAKIVAEKASLRRLIEVAGEIAGMAYAQTDEPAEILGHAESKVLAIRSRGASKSNFKSLKQSLQEEWEALDARGMDSGVLTGVPTGFGAIDDLTGGLQDGDFVIVAGRPSMGKTSLAIQMGLSGARAAGPTAVFSAEMSEEAIRQRILCMEGSVDSRRLRSGKLTKMEWYQLSDASDKLWKLPFHVDDSTDVSAMDIRTKCRELKALEGDLRLVVIDYLQLLRPIRDRGNVNIELTETAKALKQLAREMDCPVIALSQLSRAVERREDKRPMLSDLRDSGGLEAEADVVGFVYRPAYYAQKKLQEQKPEPEEESNNIFLPPPPSSPDDAVGSHEPEQEEAEVIIAKQRNGPTGRVKLGFVSSFARFENLKGPADGSPDF